MKDVKGQASSIQYATLVLVLIAIVISGVSLSMIPGNTASQSSVDELKDDITDISKELGMTEPDNIGGTEGKFHELTRSDIEEIKVKEIVDIIPDFNPVPQSLKGKVKVEMWSDVNEFTDEQKEKIKEMDLAGQYFDCTPDPAGILSAAGTKDLCEELGVKFKGRIISMGEEDQNKQLETYETQNAAGTVDFIGVEPANYKAQVDRYKDMGEKGCVFSFVGASPNGMSVADPGFATLGGPSLKKQGIESAKALVKILNEEGQIGLLSYSVPYYCSEIRVVGAKEVFEEYPGIEIVDHQQFRDPAKSGDIVRGMITAHPEMDGLWVVWTVPPALDAASAAMDMGVYGDEFAITSIDLGGTAGSKAIADEKNPLKMVSAGDYYKMGKVSAGIALKYILGDNLHPRVTTDTKVIARCNLEEGYEWANHPSELEDFSPLSEEILRLLE